MSDLSPRARRLIELGRVGDEPDAAAKDRVRSRLLLAAGTAAAASATAKTATAAGKLWAGAAMVKIAGGVCAVGIAAGGATWFAASRAPDPQPQQQVQAPAVRQHAIGSGEQPETPVIAVAEPEATVEAQRPTRQKAAAIASTSAPMESATAPSEPPAAPSSLEGEIRLLRDAQAALSRGDASRSLELLEQHQSRYPNGVMSQEREAARVIALCKLGRRDEARAEAAHFVEQHPTSPLSARVRGSCAR